MSKRLETLIANATDLSATVDRSGCLTFVAPSVRTILGIQPGAIVGKVIWELVHPDDVVGVHGVLMNLFASGGRRTTEFQMQRLDGEWRTLEATLQHIEEDGSTEVALTAADVTETRQLASALRQRDEQLRQTQRAEILGRLAGGISHDFGNLLMVITGGSRRILDRLPAGSPLREEAEAIRDASERAASMVRQLLAFSRPQNDARVVLDLNVVVAEAEQLLRRLLGEHIELTTLCSRDLWRVKAERSQVEQVLLNLAVNARDAMRSGGRLTIETKNLSSDAVAGYHIGRTGPSVAVCVTDTGIGMDAATRAHAFDPFFTTKAAGEGTGLGLATVHAIAEQHGGWTHVQSEPGQGTTITFALPSVTERGMVAAPSETLPRGGTETVLVVEDEDGVRDLVREMLEISGYRVLEAGSPKAAVRISTEFTGPIDLLLTDVVMPEMSGLELSAQLRTTRPALRVMYMSGFPEPMVGEGAAIDADAHFISKPFDRPALLRTVRQALDSIPDA